MPFSNHREENMSKKELHTIEYIIVLISGFAASAGITETHAFRYLNSYGAIALCQKHYDIMHTLSVEDNINTLRDYCQRKGGSI